MLTMNSKINEWYLDYVNNYMTVARFAEDNCISENCAKSLLSAIKLERESQIQEEVPAFVAFDVAKAEQASVVVLDGVSYEIYYTINESDECYCAVLDVNTKEEFCIEDNKRFKTIEYLKLTPF